MDVGRRVGQKPAHAFAVHQLAALRFALRDVTQGDVQRLARKTEPAHAMGQTRPAEPYLHHLETVPNSEQPVFIRNLETIEAQLAMSAMLLGTHDRDAPHDLPTRRVAVEHEGGE